MTSQLCIFGEVLYDHFPDGQQVLGGAPFNVAWHLQAFGQSPLFVSRVGDDREGENVRAAMRKWGMNDAAVGIDRRRPTGKVSVTLEDGEPSYDILPQRAYDAILPPPPGVWDLLYHGSLATREPGSRQTLRVLRAGKPGLIFVDVNLRPPWWQRDAIADLLTGAHWAKLNRDELALLQPGEGSGRVAMETLLKRFALDGVILTCGAEGAALLTVDGDYSFVVPEPATAVVDTVGAGDAFTAVMIVGLVQKWPPQRLLPRAQQFASRIVGLRGATSDDLALYAPFVNAWQAAP